jgi:hypothetical protein
MHHLRGWGTPKCFLAVLLPCSFTYFITFNFKPTVYEILIRLLHILGINVFSTASVLLHATEQLVHGTVQLCFFLTKDEPCDNHSYPSSKNLSCFEGHIDAHLDH